MGQINFEAWQTKQNATKAATTTKTNNTFTKDDKPYVGYFTLKNDKDYAIVRIMHDSPADFDMVTGHRVTIKDKLRMVNCLREDINDPVEKCPLCAAGKKTEDKIYIHLIEYSTDPQGQIVATPKIWERSASFANTLINKINDYGPLSEVIFKIIRNGEAGSKKTSYDLNFMNPAVYRPEIYQKKAELFEGYKAVGNVVWNFKEDKLIELVNGVATTQTQSETPQTVVMEGVTPRMQTYESTAPTVTPTQQPNVPTYEIPTPQPVVMTAPNTPTYPTNNTMSNDNANVGVTRPQRRYYN